MASITSNAAIPRPRPSRPPANSSKPLQVMARSTISSASALQLSSHVSNVSLFLTNLRLLDLDLRPDWPDINPLTFSAKDAAQGQKKRIQCVEWALYQLFCLWDPDQARNKLQPFFPPLDQVQSLNLRAALLRSLEQAKKNGVLGRDVLIRKTMLDECKGERMEEVLAVFSSAVLKNLVAEQHLNQRGHPALAQTLALENRGYSGQTTDLTVLALAHTVSLNRHLRNKDAFRERYNDFSKLLDLKERTLSRRREQAKAMDTKEPGAGALGSIDAEVKHDIQRIVRNNWSGNEQWMETLLHGDLHSRKDALLSTPFDRVWRRVQSGRLSEFESHTDGLLQQLGRRVNRQRERLEKWRAFRTKIHGRGSSDTQDKTDQPSEHSKGVDLGFGAHENLVLGRMSPRRLTHKPGHLSTEYADIIGSLEQELVEVAKNATSVPLVSLRDRDKPTREPLEPQAEEAVSEVSEMEELDHGGSSSQGDVNKLDDQNAELTSRAMTTHDNPAAKARPNVEAEPTPLHRREPIFRQSQDQSTSRMRRAVQTSPVRSSQRPCTPTHSPTRHIPSPEMATLPDPPQPVADYALFLTQAQADQILASLNAASPSPVKKPRHILSLAERTRLSMARRNSKGLGLSDDEDDEPELSKVAQRSPPTVTISPVPEAASSTVESAEDGEESGYQDLVSRTRRSMAGFEAARKKAQLDRRRSQRQSSRPMPLSSGHRRDGSGYFSSVDEEKEEVGDTTLLLAEKLMNNETDDYEAIFKSRPKIKTSPVGTPVKGWAD